MAAAARTPVLLRLHSAPREATLPAAQPATREQHLRRERHVSDSPGMSGAGRSRDRAQAAGRFRFLPRAESWLTRRAASTGTSTPSMQRGPRSLSGRGCSAGGVGPRRAARGTPGLNGLGYARARGEGRTGRSSTVDASCAHGSASEAESRSFLCFSQHLQFLN